MEPKQYDADGRELPGTGGYKYFGALARGHILVWFGPRVLWISAWVDRALTRALTHINHPAYNTDRGGAEPAGREGAVRGGGA